MRFLLMNVLTQLFKWGRWMMKMDLVVNYLDSVVNCVCTRYLDSTPLGHSRSRDLLHNFLLCLKSLNKTKLIQVPMDGSNANWAFYSELRRYTSLLQSIFHYSCSMKCDQMQFIRPTCNIYHMTRLAAKFINTH